MKTEPLIYTVLIIYSALTFNACRNTSGSKKPTDDQGISKEFFGLMPNGDSTWLYTLKSDDVVVKITNYGGIITEIIAPDKKGNPGNVVLGFDNLDQYLAGHPAFGPIVGRYANRIANGTFELDGNTYSLTINDGNNTLHGGSVGFDDVVWDPVIVESENGEGLLLNYMSMDGEEGFPGNLNTNVLYELVENRLEITYRATTDQATPVNITNHTYFNLAGNGTILDHILTLNASAYTLYNDELIPTGEIASVKGTPFNFTEPKSVGKDIEQTRGGYDLNFVIDRTSNDLQWIARVEDPKTGRTLDVLTMEPGVQLYTGNFLDGSLVSNGTVFVKHSGLCLETQHFPDSPNHPHFPSTILRPGDEYYTKTIYRFGVAE